MDGLWMSRLGVEVGEKSRRIYSKYRATLNKGTEPREHRAGCTEGIVNMPVQEVTDYQFLFTYEIKFYLKTPEESTCLNIKTHNKSSIITVITLIKCTKYLKKGAKLTICTSSLLLKWST